MKTEPDLLHQYCHGSWKGVESALLSSCCWGQHSCEGQDQHSHAYAIGASFPMPRTSGPAPSVPRPPGPALLSPCHWDQLSCEGWDLVRMVLRHQHSLRHQSRLQTSAWPLMITRTTDINADPAVVDHGFGHGSWQQHRPGHHMATGCSSGHSH